MPRSKKLYNRRNLKKKTRKIGGAVSIMRRKSVAEGGLMYKAKDIIREDPYPVANPVRAPLTEAKSPLLMTKVRASQQSAIKEATFQPTFSL